MSRYTNAELDALTPSEDMILDVDAQWDLAFEKFENEDHKQDRQRKQAKQDRRSDN